MRTLILLLFFSCPLSAQPAADPARWEKTIQRFEATDREKPVPPGGVLFVGSSSVVKWNTLAKDLPGHTVVNRGFGGSNFHDLIFYADRVIYPCKPGLIFVYEGDNDLAQGDSPREVLESARKLRDMIAGALGDEVPVVFISPKPSLARWNLKAAYETTNELLWRYTENTGNTYFADVWYPSLTADGEVMDDIFVEDDLHMNAEGYKIWAEVIGKMLEREGW